MTQEQTPWRWLDTRETVSLTELSQCCGLTEADIDELVDYCALQPMTTAEPERTFSAHWVLPLRHAAKMRHDFDLDLLTVAILLDNFNRIEALQRQVRALQALLPAHLHASMGFDPR